MSETPRANTTISLEQVELNFQKRLEEDEKRRLYAGIPKRFENAKLSDFQKIDKVTAWVAHPEEFLLIIGECGTGKSHLACAIAIELRKKNIPTRIVFSSDLFLAMRRSFNRAEHGCLTEFEIVELTAQAPVLVCDDIGVQKQSEFVIEAWYNIIDARYREQKPTVFTSNLSPKEISIHMSDRIASRLASGTVVTIFGKDRRLVA